jgi:16S rRNA (cytosine967-C5)-methyltransferase
LRPTIFEAAFLSGRSERNGAELRAHAARLNSEVVDRGRSLATLSLDGEDWPERDRSLLKAMLAQSLRWHHRFQWQLSQLLDRPLKRKDAELAALLRIGLTQLQILRIPDHAAVSATVDAASILGLARARGLVNAVLRRCLREQDRLAELGALDPVARFSHPEWLIARIKHDWPEDYESILEGNNAPPPLWVRVNRTRVDRDSYLQQLETARIPAAIHAECPDAVLIEEPRPVHELPGFWDGFVSVQDAAAQRAVELMQLAPGLRVLDACAAPGGKAAHMLERVPELGELVALDQDGDRLTQVRDNLDRLGLSATLVVGDANSPDAWFDGELFDRVLIDAPCTATGVIRRHPDIKLLRREQDVAELTTIQARMLAANWLLLKPGGLLIYATCSVLKDENLGVVEAFARRTGDADLAPFGSDRHYQLKPGESNTDGFYYACLVKGGVAHRYQGVSG